MQAHISINIMRICMAKRKINNNLISPVWDFSSIILLMAFLIFFIELSRCTLLLMLLLSLCYSYVTYCSNSFNIFPQFMYISPPNPLPFLQPLDSLETISSLCLRVCSFCEFPNSFVFTYSTDRQNCEFILIFTF